MFLHLSGALRKYYLKEINGIPKIPVWLRVETFADVSTNIRTVQSCVFFAKIQKQVSNFQYIVAKIEAIFHCKNQN